MSRITTFQLETKLKFALVSLCLFGCVQPWIVAPAGGLTLNAYDLAEWASLIPAQRATTPPLLVPLLLRLQFVIVGALLASIVQGRRQKLAASFAIAALAIGQLPPIEFALDINNLNYRQQFVLAIISLGVGFALLLPAARRVSRLVTLFGAGAGIATSAFGLSQAMALYSGFHLRSAIGAGFWITGLSYLALIAIALVESLNRRRAER